MFEGLFTAMRAEGLPVALDEWLLLQSALEPHGPEPTRDVLAQLGPDHKLVVVRDGCMAPSELAMVGGAIDLYQHNDEPGWVWLERLAGHFHASAWLKPVPARWWESAHGAPTLDAIRRVFPMYEMTLDGLGAAVEGLMARR